MFSAISIVYQVFVYDFDTSKPGANQMLEVISFAIMLVLTISVYIPFLRHASKTWKRVDEPKYKSAFKSLVIMAIGFITIFICFLMDRLMLIFFQWAYSIFYFMAWIFAIIAIYAAYRGYLYPKSQAR